MTGVGRAATVAGGLVLSMVLAGCASSGSADGSGSATGTDSSATSGVGSSASSERSGVEIANPKDAAALDPCELLSDEAANALGMGTDGESSPNDLKPSLPDICRWERVENDSTSIALTAFSGRSIQQYYDNKSNYGYFRNLDISGYPAVVANAEDPSKSACCVMYMAAKNDQVVMSSTSVSPGDVDKVNTCGLSRKALKLSLSSWPVVG